MANEILELVAKQVILEGCGVALSVMESMCVNEGQSVTFLNHIVEAFVSETELTIETEDEYEWNDVDLGDPYMTFMGEIVEEGNQIMQEAVNVANSIEGNESEGLDGGFFDALESLFDIFGGGGDGDEWEGEDL